MYTSKAKLFVSFLLLITSASLSANDDIAQISQVVQKYFDGTAQGKPELIKQAFLPSLELQFVRDGELKRMPRAEYLAIFKPGKPHDRIAKIISIDVTGDAAVVKATVAMGEKLATDYLLLLKLGQQWRVSNKISSHKR
jgi:hypothetical protein